MLKKILISQPQPTSEKSPYFDIASKYGVEFLFHPFIKIEGITPKEFRAQKVQILDHTAVVFNSRHAIDHFFTLSQELRISIPDDMKYFVTSGQVSQYIQKYVQYRKRKVFFPETGKLTDLVAIMGRHKQERYLVPQSDVSSDEFHKLLEAKKLNHTECVMYRTVTNPMPEGSDKDLDMIVLFTPTGVTSLLEAIPDFKDRGIKLACFSKSTAKAITDAGLTLDFEGPLPGNPSITGSLECYIQEQNKEE